MTPDFDRSTWNSVGSDCRLGGGDPHRTDGNYLYFITTEGGSSYINRIDLEGRIEKITAAPGSVDSYDVRDGKILFIGLRGLRLQELYALEEGTERKLTSFNDWVQEERTLSVPEPLRVETAPGVTVDSWVIKPVHEEGRKYPAILDIHSGPKTDDEVFFHEMQLWANEGYFVFFCNPAPLARSNEFADIRGKWHHRLRRPDGLTDAVLARPGIDQQGRVAGGPTAVMTGWIIGHTDRRQPHRATFQLGFHRLYH